jgi:hypothetical protein
MVRRSAPALLRCRQEAYAKKSTSFKPIHLLSKERVVGGFYQKSEPAGQAAIESFSVNIGWPARVLNQTIIRLSLRCMQAINITFSSQNAG